MPAQNCSQETAIRSILPGLALGLLQCHFANVQCGQTVINVCGSDSSPHETASAPFSLVLDPEHFVDVALIRCFNKACIHDHLNWLQSCDDLSGVLGFSSHHIAVRFCLMDRDLCGILAHEVMKNCTKVFDVCGTLKAGEKFRRVNKLNIFMREACDSLHKHFARWMSPALLPAGLLSEPPTAKAIAAAALKQVFPSFAADAGVVDDTFMSGQIDFQSTVHKGRIDLVKFDAFIPQRLTDNDDGCSQEAKIAAGLIVEDKVDMRSFDHQDASHGAIWLHVHFAHLPLASQTQFVESHVKEANLVSQTDRSEELRTFMAIIRSASPLVKHKTDKQLSHNVNKIQALIKSAED